MSAHGIDVFNIEFWRSGPPQLVHEQVQTHTRPGADGIGQTKLGQWGRPFSSTIEMHFSSFANALLGYGNFTLIVGTGPVQVKYGQVNYLATFGHMYLVDTASLESCSAHPRLKGPGYDYIGGGRVVLTIQMTPFRP